MEVSTTKSGSIKLNLYRDNYHIDLFVVILLGHTSKYLSTASLNQTIFFLLLFSPEHRAYIVLIIFAPKTSDMDH